MAMSHVVNKIGRLETLDQIVGVMMKLCYKSFLDLTFLKTIINDTFKYLIFFDIKNKRTK